MCGRFALNATEQEIVSHFQLKRGFFMRPRYNIAPTQQIPVILNQGQQVDFCRWGFIPAWQSKQEEIPAGHINARFESLAEKPTFKKAFFTQRCLIPATGYYEWKTINAKKQPFLVQQFAKPLFAFAGLWSAWLSAKGEMIMSCAIITIPAPSFLSKLHERMPLIISPEKYSFWLAKENIPDQYLSLNSEISPENFRIFPVSSRMNHPQFEGRECIQSL